MVENTSVWVMCRCRCDDCSSVCTVSAFRSFSLLKAQLHTWAENVSPALQIQEWNNDLFITFECRAAIFTNILDFSRGKRALVKERILRYICTKFDPCCLKYQANWLHSWVPNIQEHCLMLQQYNTQPHVAGMWTQFLEVEHPGFAWPAS